MLQRIARRALLLALGVVLGARAAAPDAANPVVGVAHFASRSALVPYVALPAAAQAQFEFGHDVFNTRFVAADTPGAGRRAGLGPLYNGASCDECHNEGRRARGPQGDGAVPAGLVLQLSRSEQGILESEQGDPAYGHVFNTEALTGTRVEGRVSVRYQAVAGRYPDGTAYQLRRPAYTLAALGYGPLQPDTVLQPRLAPQLFGVGLLNAVPQQAILRDARAGDVAWRWSQGQRVPGRFGWQATAVSVEDQTTRALSREMGLTSGPRRVDDCTPAEAPCASAPDANPEVGDELLAAVLAFQATLAVPQGDSMLPAALRDRGARLFAQTGCAACHLPHLPVVLPDGSSAQIAPYTDLRTHDLGDALADRTVAGELVASRWRTAPLWGIHFQLTQGLDSTFLHDGRARTLEEAVLWHGGEAGVARTRFMRLPSDARRQLLAWLAAR